MYHNFDYDCLERFSRLKAEIIFKNNFILLITIPVLGGEIGHKGPFYLLEYDLIPSFPH